MQQSIYQKIRQMREEVVTLDWTPDKSYIFKGTKIDYVTISKMRKNFAPLFAKCGLDFDFNILEVTNHEDYVRIKVEFIITDVDSEQMNITTLFADGSSEFKDGHNDKAIEIALSYAGRMYFTTKFQIADGIEADTEGDEVVSNVQLALDERAIPEEPVIKVVSPTIQPVVKIRPVVESQAPSGHKTVILNNKSTQKPVDDEQKPDVSIPVETPKSPLESNEESTPVSKTVGEEVKAVNVNSNPKISDKEKIASDKAWGVIEKAYKEGQLVEESYHHAKSLYDNLDSNNVAILLHLKKDIEGSIGKDVGM